MSVSGSTWATRVPVSETEIACKSAQLIMHLIKTIGHLWLSLTTGNCFCPDNTIKSTALATAFYGRHESLMRSEIATSPLSLSARVWSLLAFWSWQLTYLATCIEICMYMENLCQPVCVQCDAAYWVWVNYEMLARFFGWLFFNDTDVKFMSLNNIGPT